MRSFTALTIHPDFMRGYAAFGALRAATEKNLARFDVIALRDYAVDKHGSIDDHPYGGGDGMVMRPEPLAAALTALRRQGHSPHVILTSPAGHLWTQQEACRYALDPRPLVFVCGRFAGVDQRFIDTYVDREISCGDVVLTGGELPALLMIDSIIRLLPGVLGNSASATEDSFAAGCGGGLEYPLYTRPAAFEGQRVPGVLLSGDHAAIAAWRRRSAEEKTRSRRPDLALSQGRE